MPPGGLTAGEALGAFEATWERAEVRPETTALMVVDMVNHQLTPGTGLLKQLSDGGVDCGYLIDRVTSTVVPGTAALLEAFRSAGAAVAFLRAGGAAAGPREALPSGRASPRQRDAAGDAWACEVIPALAPVKGELSLAKRRPGGFTTSYLDQRLRFMGIRSVFYTGVLSNECVLVTMAAGFDLGYDGYMVTDATAALSEPLQAATEEIAATAVARRVTAKEAESLLASATRRRQPASPGGSPARSRAAEPAKSTGRRG